jgi:hypothetical protein
MLRWMHIPLRLEWPVPNTADKLKNIDYLVCVDYTHISDEEKQQWLKYRQELRDITKHTTPMLDNNDFLINVTWPIPPKNILINDIF